MTLSDKITQPWRAEQDFHEVIDAEDVKEFIMKLKARSFKLDLEQMRKLNELAGEKLI